MIVFLYVTLLICSLYAISKSADLFIESGSALGFKLRLKDYLIGSLIVGIGTSLPEFVTSLSAVVEGHPVLVAPNVFGTVTANILAGIGFSAVFLFFWVKNGSGKTLFASIRSPFHGGKLDFHLARPLDTAMPFALFSVILSYFLCLDGDFSTIDAFLFLLAYFFFMGTELNKHQATELEESVAQNVPRPDWRFWDLEKLSLLFDEKNVMLPLAKYLALLLVFVFLRFAIPNLATPEVLRFDLAAFAIAAIMAMDFTIARSWAHGDAAAEFLDFRESALKKKGLLFLIGYVVVSLAVVFISGDLVVKSVVFLAEYFELSSTALAASIIALGTSLPDIVVAIKVARKGRHELLIGHIIQSNVFDVLLIMGVCGLVVPLPIDPQSIALTIPFALGSNVMLLAILQDNEVSGAEGAFLIISYAAFLGLLYGVS